MGKEKAIASIANSCVLQVRGRPIESPPKQAAAHFQQLQVTPPTHTHTNQAALTFCSRYLPINQLCVCVCVSGRRSPLWRFHQMESTLSLERWVCGFGWFVEQFGRWVGALDLFDRYVCSGE